MKKMFALVLALILMLSVAALAEPAGAKVSISEIVLTVEGKTVALNPTVDVCIGNDGAGSYWLQAAVVNNGENAIALQAVLADNVLLATIEGSSQALYAEDLAALTGSNFDVSQVTSALDQVLPMVGSITTDMITEDMLSSLPETTAVEILGENSVRISAEESGASFSAVATWSAIDGTVAFADAIAEMELVPFDPETVANTDIASTAMLKGLALLGEPSIAQLVETFGGAEFLSSLAA